MCHIPSHPWALRHRLCPAHSPTVCPTRSPTSPPYPTRLPRLRPLQRPEPSACSSGPSCLWPYQEHAESAQQHLLQGAFPAFPRRLVVPSPCLVTGSANTLLPDLRPQQTGGSLGAVPCFNVMSQHCTWQEFEEFFLNEPTGEQLKPPAPVKGSKAPLALCPEETPLPGTPSMAALPSASLAPHIRPLVPKGAASARHTAMLGSGDHGDSTPLPLFQEAAQD